MNDNPAITPQRLQSARRALARAVGLAAFVHGYPLVESMRTCRLQTSGGPQGGARAAINALHHARRPSTHEDRDIVTPANDLLYSTAWIHLADGPCLLTVPSARKHGERYFVLALYDAWTENFANLGPRSARAEGETVALVGPSGGEERVPPGVRIVECPTDLVWLIGRILVADAADAPAARALQDDIGLQSLAADGGGRRPAVVQAWPGEPADTMALVFEQGMPARAAAPLFFAQLCRALAEVPAPPGEAAQRAWFAQAGLAADARFDWAGVEPVLQEGLSEGLADGVELVAAMARSRRARPWVLASRAGRYGHDHLTRALTAYIGLGALATDEAIYGAGHFDADSQPLDGRHRYTQRFAPGETPPAEAFWSVTLYDADRFLLRNALGRHAIGDRTQGLRPDADGGLTLHYGAEPPADPAAQANWLPAPAGPFYLILRLYHPREGARAWRVPPLQRAGR